MRTKTQSGQIFCSREKGIGPVDTGTSLPVTITLNGAREATERY